MELTDRYNHPAYRIYQLVWRSLDWLLPPNCGSCNQPGDRLCLKCRESILIMPRDICSCCGEPVFKQGKCQVCHTAPPAFSQLRSYAIYSGPIRNALQRLKFRRNVALGETLSAFLIDYFPDLKWSIDLVIPVPLSTKRYRERGYNQVEYIARPFSLAYGLAYSPQALMRKIDNPSQVGLSGEQRRKNVIGAFKANHSKVRGRRVLVIDDISTTGATMEACARALIEAGAQDVYGLTLARALRHASASDQADLQFQSGRSPIHHS